MPSSTIRRQMKNVVNNYSEAEKKVREATSNDPWGPSSSLMSEISDLTYNVVAFSEIMSMIWKRLNDHGKNWRHVYKALTLLDYLIKTGSERVALQCKENIFAIQTLKDFQYIDRDGKDQGINVREKSKQLVVLLKDDDRLKGERSQALKTKERMAQVATSVGSNHQINFGRGSSQPNLSTSYSEEYGRSEGSPASYHGCKFTDWNWCNMHTPVFFPHCPHPCPCCHANGLVDSTFPSALATSPNASSELEQARPQTSGEEELQLQLALAMSREAAEQEERMRRGDDLRLQMALEESRKDSSVAKVAKKKKEVGAIFLGSLFLCPGAAPKPAAPVDPWGLPSAATSLTPMKSSDPWGSTPAAAAADPWGSGPTTHSFDLFSTSNGTSKEDLSDFDSLRSSALPLQTSKSASPSLFDLQPSAPTRKTPESFLGPNAALVNLDSLVTKPPQPAPISNPFLAGGIFCFQHPSPAPAPAAQVNPFQVNQPQPPTLNQMRVSPMMGMTGQGIGNMTSRSNDPLGMAPLAPMGQMMPSMGMPGSMSVPQPLMSGGLQPTGTAAQAGGTTNPFLL
uniref:ENTH domain-containing protein n=1 Tax=Pygocentrus nattereri TaxID=42514 RepID=A0A3B4D175_PYGNA